MIIGNESDIGASLSDIWRAWYKFKQGKKKNRELDTFSYSLESNLSKLHQELLTHSYQHGSYRTFSLTDTKRRVISVATIRDRVVHRLIYDYLVSIIDKRFIFDVWSCRKDKGLLGAIERTQKLLASNRHAYIWRSDVTKFFDSVNHDVLKSCVRRRVGNVNDLKLIDNVIDSFTSDAPGKGIPIGNLTSQIFCNIYLHELDHYINHTIRPKGYLRYGDDFIVIVEKRDELEEIKKEVTKFIEQTLKLTLNKKNNILISVKRGIHFLGCDIYPTGRRLRKKMYLRIDSRLNLINCASYRSLILTHTKKKSSNSISNKVKWIDWKIADTITQIQ
ncbi:MAG: RNA-directed DNA polymerase [Candidatus Woesebacteria bacterium GW2011_GWA1_39_8]|uniref:RNA-directed DNA polymerase n=2 Tax=Candidatus Woeseibacteriota TaxID=1752722 RepID=A0A0G0SVB5_9BACT|nr:MAG: RNA-directed DNA polymerase [Candidatus Woesebacteria bacterium GW2011_GWA1_39_8]OGM21616.1 MAG: hypothetical protein A2863_00445 [Candidatus Woesebacteria bacterium RIFCSPHIGHO2_01_FULL_38_9b]